MSLELVVEDRETLSEKVVLWIVGWVIRVTLVNGRSFLDAEKGAGLSKKVADEVVIASQGRRGETLRIKLFSGRSRGKTLELSRSRA